MSARSIIDKKQIEIDVWSITLACIKFFFSWYFSKHVSDLTHVVPMIA